MLKISFTIISVFVVLVSCAGKEKNKIESDNAQSFEELKITTETNTFKDLTENVHLGTRVFCTQQQLFKIPDNTVSMLISATSSDSISFLELVDPTGKNLLDAGSIEEYQKLPLRPVVRTGFSGLLIPNRPSSVLESGEWKLTACTDVGEPLDLSIRYRERAISSRPILPIQPFLTGDRFHPESIIDTLEGIRMIYEKSGFAIDIQSIILLKDERFQAVPPDFKDGTTIDMVANNVEDKINLFFVEDFDAASRSLLGLSAALPGPQGSKNPYNAVVINLTTHTLGRSGSEGVLDSALLAETAAHEIGHWLGLHHTTERSGEHFDPLDDTAECDDSLDSNRNRKMDPSECEEHGANNLMFWVGSGSLNQTVLSSDQRYVIQHALIAR